LERRKGERVLETLREAIALAAEDVRAVLARDPAARRALEVVLVYPGLHALWIHRVAHGLWRRDLRLCARVLSHAARFATGVEIHPAARIGRRVVIDHGMGVVIGETARVGDDCLLYAGVVLGAKTQARTQRHPALGRKVVVGTNAAVLGPIAVGDGARIGAGAVVLEPVPAGATVVGAAARIAQAAATRDDAAARAPDSAGDERAPAAGTLYELPGRALAPLRRASGDER
jgi:serine O-acetyltransferase